METMKELKVGQKVRVLCKSNGLCVCQTAPYPFWNEQWVPVEIIGKNKNFYTARTLPHIKPVDAWGPAKSYVVSIDKFDIEQGLMVVKEYKYEKH